MEKINPQVGAVVLAAGQSRRMGRPKMALPWGETTVIGQVTSTLFSAGADPVVVVIGAAEVEVLAALCGQDVLVAHNLIYMQGDMLVSLQRGLTAVPEPVEAVLVALGDQPQIDPRIVQQVIERFRKSGSGLVVPSFQMRRGHPWLIARRYWAEILEMREDQTMRDFLNQHAMDIDYVNADNPSILKDLDTPEDYEAQRPG